MPESLYTFTAVAIMAAITALIRFLPFMLFHDENRIPPVVRKLADALPGAMMAMLVVYCFKGVSLFAWPYGLPEFLAGALCAALYLYKRSVVMAILVSTIVYMILIQAVFV